MTDNFDLTDLLSDLDDDQIKQVIASMTNTAQSFKQPQGRTAEQILADLDQNTAQLKRTLKDRALRGQRAQLTARQDELFREHAQLQQVQAREAKQPQIAALQAEIDTLSAELQLLQLFPSRNRARIRELRNQLEPKWQQLENLQK